MANEPEATGHNIRDDEEEWTPDPSKLKPKKPKDATAAAPPPPPPAAAVAPPPPPPPPPLPPEPIAVQVVAPPPPPPPPPTSTAAPVQFPMGGDSGGDMPMKPEEPWMKSMWRPAMGWLYMIICFMDFVGFPLLTIFLPIIFKPFGLTMPYTAWQSLTLSNGGLIHLSFGAILGVSAWTRGQEKKV